VFGREREGLLVGLIQTLSLHGGPKIARPLVEKSGKFLIGGFRMSRDGKAL